MEENVIVSVRARPLNEKEISACGLYTPWTIDKERQIIVYTPAIDALTFSSPTTASLFKNAQVIHIYCSRFRKRA